MLKTQEYLATHTFDELSNDLGIKLTYHETEPLVILNYSQLDSPKTHSVVRECRGLVLHAETKELVARSFPRFFNIGEVLDEMPLFNFNNFHTTTKHDGSLCIVFNHNNRWYVNTRGSFGDGIINNSQKTWHQGFCEALKIDSIQDLKLDPCLTYVTEFCSLYNKVVRSYRTPSVYFLTAFYKEKEIHLDCPPCFLPTERFDFSNIEEITDYILKVSEEDATYEGVVICDDGFRRWKLKSLKYLALHTLKGNDEFSLKNILPFVLNGDEEEMLTYFPEVEEEFFKIKEKVDGAWHELLEVWRTYHKLESQKEFALAIVPRTFFSSILFKLRKNKDQNEEMLRREWQNSTEMILKFYEKL